MAETKKTATTKTTTAQAKKPAAKKSAPEKAVSNLPAIKDALIYAHDTLFNSRALSDQDFEEVGLTKQAKTQWEMFVEELRQVSNAYIDLAQDPNARGQQISAAEGKVWAEWRRVLKQGTEKDFSEKMFIRKADVVFISGLCGTKFQKTATAKVLAHQTATDFRRNIETLIGIRMAGNSILSDTDRDIIVTYEAACRTLQSRTDALNGYTRGKNKVEGLYSKFNAQRQVLLRTKESYDKVNMPQEMQEELLTGLREAIKATEADIKAAKEAITKAKKTIKKTEEAYQKIMNCIKPIAGETFGEYKADVELTPEELEAAGEEPEQPTAEQPTAEEPKAEEAKTEEAAA